MHGRTLRRLLLVTSLVAGVGLATEAAAIADTASNHSTAVAAKKKQKKPTVKIADSDFGEILVDTKGFTLYAFNPDGTNTDQSQCTGNCAATWPPLEAKKLRAGKGLEKSLLASNSSQHISYNGHLLYRYSGDAAKGETNGQGLNGVWHVVGADGNPIT